MPGTSSARGRRLGWWVLVAATATVGWLLVEPLRRSDLMVFIRAAGDVTAGRNPYTPLDDPFLWHGSAYVYPYLTSYLFVPLTWLPVPAADVLWFVVSAAAVVVGCRSLDLRDPYGITAVVVSATCIRSLQVGAINALLFCGLALMWRWRDRTSAVAAAFAFVAGAKLFLLPMAVWIALCRRRRVAVAAAVAVSTYLGLGLLLEPISPTQFTRSMSELASHEGPHSMSVLRWSTTTLPSGLATVMPLLVAGVVVAATVAWSARRPGRRSRALFAACVLASLLATPIYWSHYTLLVAAPVLLASPTRRAAAAFCGWTWLVMPPVLPWGNWQVPMSTRLTLLYAGMAVAPVAVLMRAEPGSDPPVADPFPELDAAAVTG